MPRVLILSGRASLAIFSDNTGALISDGRGGNFFFFFCRACVDALFGCLGSLIGCVQYELSDLDAVVSGPLNEIGMHSSLLFEVCNYFVRESHFPKNAPISFT